MAATDGPTIVQLGVADAPAGLLLSTEAHWNQNEADWRFFLTHGCVYGVRDGKRLVASAALLPYAAGQAWISMVLVTADWRRRGLATRLIDACLRQADRLDLTTWLDATPAGAMVYGPLGFQPTLELWRLRLANAAGQRGTPEAGDLDGLIARDRAAMGFDREELLRDLAARPGSHLYDNGKARALVRDGRTARHVGPLFADNTESARAMIRTIAAREAGPLLMDAVASQREFVGGLDADGWMVERPFQRMRLGRATVESQAPPFAVAGPEFG
jgi:GNAT superfamily N-acetyltransferase